MRTTLENERFNYLIKRINFDKDALAEIYTYYFPRIVTYISRRYKDSYLGEDIAQEFFLKLFRINIPEKIKYPTTWVFYACDNLVKNHYNKTKFAALPFNEEIAAAATVDFDKIESNMISEESMEILEQLDKDTMEIFIMYYWEGFNYKEIAEKMNVEYATVRKKTSRGYKKLKKFLINGHILTIMFGLLG